MNFSLALGRVDGKGRAHSAQWLHFINLPASVDTGLALVEEWIGSAEKVATVLLDRMDKVVCGSASIGLVRHAVVDRWICGWWLTRG